MNSRAERRHAAMMLLGSGRPVVLIAEMKRATGEVRFQYWGAPARLKRAATALATWWGFALLSVLIPVAHFVLVPAFFIAGPIAAFRRLRQASGILGGEGTCPACGRRMVIEAHANKWPIFNICEECRASVRIETAVVV